VITATAFSFLRMRDGELSNAINGWPIERKD
jgi:hypothetical protein